VFFVLQKCKIAAHVFYSIFSHRLVGVEAQIYANTYSMICGWISCSNEQLSSHAMLNAGKVALPLATLCESTFQPYVA
jgi:hypothetical protein